MNIQSLFACTCLLFAAACGSDQPKIDIPIVKDTTVISQKNILVPRDTNLDLPLPAPDTTRRLEKPTKIPAKAEFETSKWNYGTIRQDSIVEYTFKLKNVGEMPLEINDVKGSCGCTVGSFNFLPIRANEKSEIKARFDSKGKKGKQKSTLTVYTNGDPKTYTLNIEGEVLEK